MTVLSYYARATDAPMPATFTEAEQYVKACQAPAQRGVGEIPAPLSDEDREQRITDYGRHMEECVSNAEACATDLRAFWLIEAQGWKERMEALIKGRSAAQVARMEAERGLA